MSRQLPRAACCTCRTFGPSGYSTGKCDTEWGPCDARAPATGACKNKQTNNWGGGGHGIDDKCYGVAMPDASLAFFVHSSIAI